MAVLTFLTHALAQLRGAPTKAAPKHSGKHVKYEFFGPPGAITLLIFLPLVLFGLYFACNETQCISLNPFSSVFLHAKSVRSLRRAARL